MKILCQHCNGELLADNNFAGTMIVCPLCGGTVQIPQVVAPPPPPVPPLPEQQISPQQNSNWTAQRGRKPNKTSRTVVVVVATLIATAVVTWFVFDGLRPGSNGPEIQGSLSQGDATFQYWLEFGPIVRQLFERPTDIQPPTSEDEVVSTLRELAKLYKSHSRRIQRLNSLNVDTELLDYARRWSVFVDSFGDLYLVAADVAEKKIEKKIAAKEARERFPTTSPDEWRRKRDSLLADANNIRYVLSGRYSREFPPLAEKPELIFLTDELTDSHIRQVLESQIASEADGRIRLQSVRKQNGYDQHLLGIRYYVAEYAARIEFLADCYWIKKGKGGNWNGRFTTLSIAEGTDRGLDNSLRCVRRQIVTISGQVRFQKTDKGWRAPE